MDERFTLLIEQMSELKEHADSVQKDITSTFAIVKTAQDEISQKLANLNTQIAEVINQFKSDGESLRDELSESVAAEIAESRKAISAAEESVKAIDNQYQTRVNSLISDISDKSKEILTIYHELDSIKIKKGEYSDFLKSAETEYRQSLESLKAEFKKAMQNSEFPKIVNQLEKLTPRIDRLEAHAHKHTFGGTKI